MKSHYREKVPLKSKLEIIDMIKPDSGCQLVREMPFLIFTGIFARTGGDPCEGCFYNNDCSFLRKKVHKEKQKRQDNFGKVSFKTNAEIAKEKGKTKRQVSKMRKRGEI